MAYENNKNFENNFEKSNQGERRNPENIFSKRVRAGKRRTYFFDVRETRGNDYFITITESKKRFNDDGYDRHKMFIYKEDFNKFLTALSETIEHVKTELMPDFDFDAFNHDEFDNDYENKKPESTTSEKEEDQSMINASTDTIVESAVKPITDEESVESWKI